MVALKVLVDVVMGGEVQSPEGQDQHLWTRERLRLVVSLP